MIRAIQTVKVSLFDDTNGEHFNTDDLVAISYLGEVHIGRIITFNSDDLMIEVCGSDYCIDIKDIDFIRRY